MNEWKEEIARRIVDREEKKHFYDVLINTIDRDIEELLNELVADYRIKANLKTIGKNDEKKWIIKIDDLMYEFTPDIFSRYFKENQDIKKSIIAIILDNFQFDFKK